MRRETMQNCTVPFTHDNQKVCNTQDDMQSSYRVATRTLEKHHCPESCRNLFINFGGKTMNLHGPKTSTSKKKSKKSDKEAGKKKHKNKKKKGKSLYSASSHYNARLSFGTRVQMIEEHQLYKFINLVAESGFISYTCKIIELLTFNDKLIIVRFYHFFFLGGFVGLFLGYSLYNLYLMIFESMEKAVKLKEKRKETKKKWNAVGQSVAIAKHLQKHIDGNEEKAISSNKPTKHDS